MRLESSKYCPGCGTFSLRKFPPHRPRGTFKNKIKGRRLT